MLNIVLDTDFLLSSIEFKVDIFTELERICNFPYQLAILDKTMDELKDKKNSKLALSLIKSKNLNIITTKKDKIVDDLLLEQNNIIVATQDKALKEKLKKRKLPIITIRQKKYLVME